MDGFTDPAIAAYVEAHTTPPTPELVALAQETHAQLASPGMHSGALEGRLLELLVHGLRAQLVLEIGTFSGNGALSMAAGLGPEGRIITCEISPVHADFAQRHIDASRYAGQIEVRRGPALETIASLDGPFDLVFIDADKVSYRAYYEAVLPKLADHGLLVVDNTLWSGRVADVDPQDSADTRALVQFNDFVAHDDRVVAVMLTVRDGITLIRRR